MRELLSFRAYLELEKRRSAHTVVAYCHDVEQFFSFLHTSYDGCQPLDVSSAMVRSWVVRMMEDGQAPTTIRRKMSSLQAFFRFLQRREGLATNPVQSVSLPKKARRVPAFVPAGGMEALFDALPTGNSYEEIRDVLIITLLYETGIRRSELLGLTRDRIDLSRKEIRVYGKRNKERLIPIGDGLAALLARYLDSRDQLLEGRSLPQFFLKASGKPLSVRSLYQIVHQYLEMVGQLERRSPHVLRHTFATHMAESGADLQAIRSLLGHSSLASTQVYTHTPIGQLKKAYLQAHPRSRSKGTGKADYRS